MQPLGIDFIGPFDLTYGRSKSVDFSMPLHVHHTSIVVPMEKYKSLWSFTDPFTMEVWIMLFISIPIYVLAMLLAAYIHPEATTDWEGIVGFVFRNAVMEHNIYVHVEAKHQKIFFICWTVTTFVLLQGYSGTLKAMVTKPTLDMEIRRGEDLLSQNKIKWVAEEGGYMESLKVGSSSSTMRSLLEQAEYINTREDHYSACFNVKHYEAGTYASICGRDDIRTLILLDYKNTGSCNYYVTNDNMDFSLLGMMFQVSAVQETEFV